MIPLVDTTLTINKPKLYLCKPNRTIISILSEAYNIVYTQKLGGLSELTFSIPTFVDIHHVKTDNPNVTNIKDRYNIKLIYDNKTEWFVINNLTKSVDSVDHLDVHCFGAGYELSDKIIRSYTSTSLNASQTLQEILADSIWDTGNVDTDFDLLYRSMDISEATVLDAVNMVSETFGSLIQWDTENREIDFLVMSENGVNRGLHFNYGQLLKSAETISESDQMCTRLKCFGKDGMSIQEINPTGQNFLEDYSFFMTKTYATGKLTFTGVPIAGEIVTIGTEIYEFVATSTSITTGNVAINLGDTFTIDNAVTELTQVLNRDSIYVTATDDTSSDTVSVVSIIGGTSGNSTATITTCANASWGGATLLGGEDSTDYMSSSLISAINAYNLFLLSKLGNFDSYLTTKSGYEAELAILLSDKTTLETELQIILDNIDVASANRESLTELNVQKTVKLLEIENKQIEIDNKDLQISSIAIEITVDSACISTGDITISIDGEDTTVGVIVGDDVNAVATKINTTFDTIYQDHLDDGTTMTYKSSVLANVVTIYYYNSSDYNDVTITFSGGTTGVTATVVNTNNGVSNLISKLNNDVSIENNFTADQITERNLYIIEKVWSDENYIDSEDLYYDGLAKFKSMRIPQLSATIDIVNFLECISEYRNWDKLNIGDYCTIYHEKLNIDILAKIIEMIIDFESGSVKLTIANVKDLQDADQLLDEIRKNSINASTTLNMERYKYNSAYTDVNDVQSILNAAWDTSLREIKSATEEKLSIDGRGLTSYNSSDPNKAIRIMHSCIGLTDDGFNTLGVAIDPTGVYAEKLVGQIIAGVNLFITNSAGNFTVNDLGVVIEDLDLQITHTENLVRIIANTTDCFKIQCNSGTTGTPVWTDTFSVSASGVLTAEDLIANKLIMKSDGDVLIDGDTKTINFTNFTTIAGVINADNINLKGLSIWNDDVPAVETLYITASGNLTMQGTLKSSIIQAGVIQGMTSGTTGTTGLNLIYFGDHGGCIDTYTDEGTGYQALRLKPGVTVTGNDAGYVQYIEDGHIYFYDNSGSGVEFAQINPDGTTTLKTHSQITEVTESTTLTLSHANHAIKSSSASPITITVPPNDTVPFLDYTEIEIINYGSGGTTIAGGTGVTVVSKDSNLSIDGQYASVSLKKLSTDEWLLVGALA